MRPFWAAFYLCHLSRASSGWFVGAFFVSVFADDENMLMIAPIEIGGFVNMEISVWLSIDS
ncbi:hypothetical protein GCM10022277_13690 [Litoribacillus peritrichatus]|uniref:Uncharacterized protein n=1 Tax=Litoribacillus peritrichatus TaxID=718191 RepID=A0ABP7MD22_9GAMM